MSVLSAAYIGPNVIDSNLSASIALPAAGASAQTVAIDTGDNTDGNFPRGVDLLLTVPATPNLAAPGVATSITFSVLADTAATPTSALIPAMTFTLAGTAGAGAAAASCRFPLPPGVARYVSIQASAGANAANNTAVSFTAQLVGAGIPNGS